MSDSYLLSPLLFPNDVTSFVDIPIGVLAVWVDKIWVVWFLIFRIYATIITLFLYDRF